MDKIDEILNYFKNEKRTEINTEIWCCQYILKLMKEKENYINPQQLSNCMLLILNLFYNKVPDRYHSEGNDINELDKKEKKKLIDILKSEIR